MAKESTAKKAKDELAEEELEPVAPRKLPVSLEVMHELEYGFFSNIPLTLSVEFGRTTVKVRDILDYQNGSVIELDKLAGEAVEVLMNRRIFAKGEALVNNDRYAVRLTDIISKTKSDTEK